MLKQQSQSKSPLTVLFLITILVISTLVMVSNYFFRPGLELDIENKVVSTLLHHKIFNAAIKVEGRDVILNGVALNALDANRVEVDIQNISGIYKLKNNLLIKNQINDDKPKVID